MTSTDALARIKEAINAAPRNGYVAEMHIQVIKYAELLQNISGKEFCESVGINSSFGTEFLKMRKISSRLVQAGLNVNKI